MSMQSLVMIGYEMQQSLSRFQIW